MITKNELMKIDLENGKYTLLHNRNQGGITVLKYGEVHSNETGNDLVLSLMKRIDELENKEA